MPLGVFRPSGSPAAVVVAVVPLPGEGCPGNIWELEEGAAATARIAPKVETTHARFSKRNMIPNCNVGASVPLVRGLESTAPLFQHNNHRRTALDQTAEGGCLHLVLDKPAVSPVGV